MFPCWMSSVMRGFDCLARRAAASVAVTFRQRASSARLAATGRLAAMRGDRVFRWGRSWQAACNRTRSRRLHERRRRLTGPRVGRRMRGAGLRSRRRDGVADRERCRRCPGLRRRAPAGLVELPCARRASWPSPLSSPVSRVRAAASRTWFVVEPSRQFSGSLRERQTAASKVASGSPMGREGSGSDSAPSAKGSSGFRVGKGNSGQLFRSS